MTRAILPGLLNKKLNWPFLQLLEGYNRNKFKYDFKAGLNVALLAFPQGMAYALIAGLPIQYGIFGSAIAALLGPIFASSKFIVLGPTNATSVMLMAGFISISATPDMKLVMLPMILLMVGFFLIMASLLKAANLIQYISTSVVTGYITAAALLIISNQIKNVLGFSFEEPASTFLGICKSTISSIGATKGYTLGIGALTGICYFVFNRKFKTLPNVAITLITMALICIPLNMYLTPEQQIATFAPFHASDWQVTWPSFDLEAINQLASIAMAIAFLSVLEGSSIGKSLAARSGATIDTNREMLSIGIANIGCSLFSGMPASGSLTRSALNWSSKAATPLASIFNGSICLIGALTLGPLIRFVPKSSLAVIVIFLGISLINKDHIRIMLSTTKRDTMVFTGTFLSALIFRLDTAIFFGTALSIILFLRKAALPELVEYTYTKDGQLTALGEGQKRERPEISIVHVEGNLFFGAAELLRNQMKRICMEPNLKVVILKMRNALHLDATAALALEELIRFMHDNDRHLLISEIKEDTYQIFESTGILDVITKENVFKDDPDNPMISTALAARRAKDIIGDCESNVTIFA